jgi:hypothetical protein
MAVPMNIHSKTAILNNNFIRVLAKFDQLFVSHQATTVSRNPWLALWGVHPMENSEVPWLCPTPGDTETAGNDEECVNQPQAASLQGGLEISNDDPPEALRADHLAFAGKLED